MKLMREIRTALRDLFTALGGVPYWPPSAVARHLRSEARRP